MRYIIHVPKYGRYRLVLEIILKIFNFFKFIINLLEKLIFNFLDSTLFKKSQIGDINYKKKYDKIVLLGNSPYVDKSFLERLKSTDLFAVNLFYLSDLAKHIKPSLYMIVHRPSENKIFDNKRIKELNSYIKTNEKIFFFLSLEWKEIFGDKKNIHYFDQTIMQITNYSSDQLLKFQIFPSISNVLIGTSYISLKMGYREIFIHGYDLNFPIYIGAPHYYDDVINKDIFDNFDKDAYKIINLTLGEWLKIKELANQSGINIYSTVKTFIPIFKRYNEK